MNWLNGDGNGQSYDDDYWVVIDVDKLAEDLCARRVS